MHISITTNLLTFIQHTTFEYNKDEYRRLQPYLASTRFLAGDKETSAEDDDLKETES